MDYIEYSIEPTQMSEENTEIISAMLGELGFESFMEEDQSIKAYIPVNLHNETEIFDFISSIPLIKTASHKRIADQNWNETWESNYPMVHIREDCIVRAPFHKKDEQIKYDLIIEPKMSFGTAHHETTFLMLQQILCENWKGKNVLDMGCGTTVLGILCMKMGADYLTAIDNDIWAYNNSLDNLAKNEITAYTAIHGGAESLTKEAEFDAILANINRNILLEDMAAYSNAIKKGGFILFSGFYSRDMDAIREKAIECGLEEVLSTAKNDWTMMKFRKTL